MATLSGLAGQPNMRSIELIVGLALFFGCVLMEFEMSLPEEIKVELRDNVPMVSSLQVAERFGKLHKIVLRSIQDAEMSEEFREHNFVLSSYRTSQNREQPMYWMTRDGFWALAMTFTGKEAARLREKIIAALNRAEEMMRQGVDALDIPLLLESAAREFRKVEHERDVMAGQVESALKQQKLIAQERTRDIDRIREAERRASEALRKFDAVARHAWKAKAEVEAMLKESSGDLFSGSDAENVMRFDPDKKSG